MQEGRTSSQLAESTRQTKETSGAQWPGSSSRVMGTVFCFLNILLIFREECDCPMRLPRWGGSHRSRAGAGDSLRTERAAASQRNTVRARWSHQRHIRRRVWWLPFHPWRSASETHHSSGHALSRLREASWMLRRRPWDRWPGQWASHSPQMGLLFIFFKTFYLFTFREGEGREKEREKNIGQLPLSLPNSGPGPQLRRVAQPGVEPATFPFLG